MSVFEFVLQRKVKRKRRKLERETKNHYLKHYIYVILLWLSLLSKVIEGCTLKTNMTSVVILKRASSSIQYSLEIISLGQNKIGLIKTTKRTCT